MLAARVLSTAIGVAWLAGVASAQTTPVDQLFCNVTCEGPQDSARCRLGIVGGNALSARRGELAPLPGGDGVVAGGNLAIPTTGNAADEIVLAEAYLELRFGKPGPSACNAGFDIVRGQARLPVPAAGVLASADVEIVHQPMASVGLDVGRNLIAADSPWCTPALDCACVDFCLDVPVPRTERHYFFFDVDARYSFRLGAAVLDSPGAAATFILDPLDPYFFLTGSVMGIPGVKTPLNAGSGGFGFSYDARIPYVPVQTFGFEDRLVAFEGDYAARVSLPLLETTKPHLSVELDGAMVVSLDPDHDGDHPFLSPEAFGADPDLALGANGLFSVSWSPFDTGGRGRRGASKKPPTQKQVQAEGKKAKKKGGTNAFLGLDLQLAGASGGGRVRPEFTEIFVSGRTGLGSDEIFPSWTPLPVRANGSLSLAGYFSTQGDESFVEGLGQLAIDPTFLGKLAKAGALSTIEAREAELRVDKNGFLIVGRSSSQLHSDVEPTSTSEVEAYIAPNGYDSHLAFRGATRVAGETFNTSELVLGPRELGFSAKWQLDAHTIDLEGRFLAKGGKLTGATTVVFPYSREDTQRKLELVRAIAEQEEFVALLERDLALAGDVFSRSLAESQTAQRNLNLAIAEVESWEERLAQLDANIRSLQSQLGFQVNTRNCNADYSGCRSCAYNCDCDCGTFDVVCHANCAACSTAYGVCQTEREACRVANITVCTADRAFQITRLSALIAAAETERFALQTAHDVALGVLGTARTANEVALNALQAAVAAVEAAEAGLAAGLLALEHYQEELDNLPAIEGSVEAVVSVEIRTTPKGATKTGKIAAKFNGKKIARGRVDLDSSPRQACITVPLNDVGEICTVL